MANIRQYGTCENCRKYSGNFRKYQGLNLCWKCYRKFVTIVGGKGRCRTLAEALNRTYEINATLQTKGTITAFRSFPSILAGHKVRLTLVDEVDESIKV
jgi:hypothetical protein